MDNLSFDTPLASTTPVKEVHSRPSGGDQQESRNRKTFYRPEPIDEDELQQDESPHTLDERA